MQKRNIKEWVSEYYKKHINETFFNLVSFMGLDEVEQRAEGCRIWDSAGREFIDCLGGYGVFSLGHRHPGVIAAVRDQLDSIPMSSKVLLNAPMALAAKRLAEVTPEGLNRVFFCNSGTEAVEGALKLARLATGKTRIIYATKAFHGKTMGSLSAIGKEVYREKFAPLIPEFEAVPFGEAEALERAINADTAAVILEPVQGEGGINVAPPGYLKAVREICNRHNILLILDEIQTGLCRTGRFFACEYEQVCPDIMTLAKALGGGVMPIGAVVGTDQVWQQLEANPILHTSTFGGNQLACRAAIATIDIMERDYLWENAEERGNQFITGLNQLKAEFPDLIKEVRGIGLMIGVEFVVKDYSELFIATLVNEGVLVAFTLNDPDVIRIEPPLIITADDVDIVLSRIKKALNGVRDIIKMM